MESFRECMTDLSQQTQDIIMASWSNNTIKSYNPYIKAWARYCTYKSISHQRAIRDIRLGIEFLTFLFSELKLSYSAVNNARSALSSFIITGNELSFGKQPFVRRLLKGMFRIRPCLPRYTVTYDANVVLEYLRNQTVMTFKQLTLKLATLLALLTGSRNQTLNSIDIDYIFTDSERMVIYIPEVLKTTTPKRHLEPLELKRYHDLSLCVVYHLELYVAFTQQFRPPNVRKLFLGLVQPLQGVTTTTVGRYVKEVLRRAGINTKIFSAHSTRSASTSLAKQKGLSLNEIRKAAGWTNCVTFARFYDKPITGPNFGQVMLQQ